MEDLLGRRTEGLLQADSGDSSEIHAATVVEQAQVPRETLMWVKALVAPRDSNPSYRAPAVVDRVGGAPESPCSRIEKPRTQANRRHALSLKAYVRKMRGTTRGSPPRVSNQEVFWSWIGAFIGIGSVGWANQAFFSGPDLTLTIGSLGASAVLLYGAVRSPLAQPRNLIGGHVISALVGVTCWKLLSADPWLAQAGAVATAIALMHLSKTLHPPGGATALIAVIGSDEIHAMGYYYVLVPATLGPLILLAVALLVNNIPATRRYPENWI
ncbi:HPP family protein [Thiocapsa marina]|uniref:HPP family protein n=1 Tax=Thiocapsa marina 5811 TaxID=768671 RepID=F9UFJ1_9GAMM|nr:HPP family protein [Thiocapsa marina]EGV16865.1 HPP family protein [Thiocapsa marina 5811]